MKQWPIYTDVSRFADGETLTFLERHRTVIIAVPSAVGAVGLVLLFGAAYGYIIVLKRIVSQAKSATHVEDAKTLLSN